MNKEFADKLAKLANILDAKGLYDYANELDSILASEWDDEKWEDTNLTIKEVNSIVDRFNAEGPESVEVISSGYDPKTYGEGETITLKFQDGPPVTISGNEWDKIQVLLGVM